MSDKDTNKDLAVPEGQENQEMTTEEAFCADLPAPTDLKIASDLGGGLGVFLPYLAISQAMSLCCQPPKSWPQGVFTLKQSADLLNLGNELDVFFCDWRPKVMFSDKSNSVLKSLHDHEDHEFEELKAKAMEAVPPGESRKYYWGFEFLLYDGKLGKYMTLFCNNATLRRAAKEKGFACIHKKVILSTKSITDRDRTWWGLVFAPLSTPFDIPLDKEELKEQIKNFKVLTAVEVTESVDEDAISAPSTNEDQRPR